MSPLSRISSDDEPGLLEHVRIEHRRGRGAATLTELREHLLSLEMLTWLRWVTAWRAARRGRWSLGLARPQARQ